VGDDIRVRSDERHRFEGLDNENIILEISRGKFDEEDIVRIEDDYGRSGFKR
jgi:mannose-1-phosphate guanylyltransferase